jgi:hypothetical protein
LYSTWPWAFAQRAVKISIENQRGFGDLIATMSVAMISRPAMHCLQISPVYPAINLQQRPDILE